MVDSSDYITFKLWGFSNDSYGTEVKSYGTLEHNYKSNNTFTDVLSHSDLGDPEARYDIDACRLIINNDHSTSNINRAELRIGDFIVDLCRGVDGTFSYPLGICRCKMLLTGDWNVTFYGDGSEEIECDQYICHLRFVRRD